MRYATQLALALMICGLVIGCGQKPKQQQRKPVKVVDLSSSGVKKEDTGDDDDLVPDDEPAMPMVVKLPKGAAEVDKPTVKADSSNVIIQNLGDVVGPDKVIPGIIPTPSSTLAAQIADTQHKITWHAKWRNVGAGSAWLPCVTLSPDRSLLAIIEKTGEVNGPFGSRLVLISTYDFKIMKIIEYKQRNVSRIRFVPDSQRVVCWSEKQEDLKEPYLLFTQDLRNGRILSETHYLKSPLAHMEVNAEGKKVFVTLKDSKDLFVFNILNLERKPKTKSTSNMGAALAFTGAGNVIAVAGDKSIEIFNNMGRVTKTLPLPKDFRADTLAFAGSPDIIAVSQDYRRVYIYRGDVEQLIESVGGTSLEYIDELKTLLVPLGKRDGLQRLLLPSLTKEKVIYPMRTRPKTKGDMLFVTYLPHLKRYMYVDNQGNLAILEQSKRRWKKEVVLTSLKRQ